MKQQSRSVKRGGRHILATTNLGVVGSPIGHSKSPILHSAAYSVLGLDWSYSRHEVGRGSLSEFVSRLDDTWRGLSVTMPVKSEAFALSSERDAHAMYTGAVNTLAFSRIDGQLVARGFNTDVFGITETLSACGLSRTDNAVIFGGGATALSALVALNELGFHSVSVALRDVTKGKDLLTLATQLGVNLRVVDINSIHELDPVDAAVSTVPGSADVRFDNLKRTPSALLLDVAYDVWPSPRSLQWASSGGVVASGLSMLAFQALRQVRIFVSDSPDVELQHESAVRSAMFASVGLNSRGL